MPTPRATQARDELGLKARLHGTPPDDVGLDAGSSLREGTGLWGWLWGPWRFSPAPRGYVHYQVLVFNTIVLIIMGKKEDRRAAKRAASAPVHPPTERGVTTSSINTEYTSCEL